MHYETKVTKTVPLPQAQLFAYFTDKSLMERWAHPDGMSLRLPVYEAKKGGQYRYEHAGKEGTFVAEGYFEEISPSRIVQIDQRIQGPQGKSFNNIRGDIRFIPKGELTEIFVLQSGFETQKDADDCAIGWQQCLDTLVGLIGKCSGQKNIAS